LAKKSKPNLTEIIVEALEDIKAKDIRVINVANITSVSDHVAIASADSNRQTRALASNVVDKVREAGYKIYGTEGEESGEWVLVDCGDVVVHIMQPAIREYYKLEELWLDGTLEFPKPQQALKAKAEAAKPVVAKVVKKKPVAKKGAKKTPTATATKARTTATTAKKPVAKKPAAKKIAAKKPAAAKNPAATKKPAAAKKPATEKKPAAATKPAATKPAQKKPAVTSAVKKTVAAKKPAAKKVVAKKKA